MVGLPSCRFCSAPLRHTFVDLGMSPLCESYVPAERLGAMEPFYPLHVRVCEQLSAGAARGVRGAGGDLHRVRLLLLLLGLLGRSRARLRGVGGRALRARRRQPGGGAGEQRRLPAPARRRAGHTGARRRARGERRRGGAGAGDRDRRRVLRSGARVPSRGARAAGPTCWSPTTCFAHVPDLNDFVAGMRAGAGSGRAWSRSSSRTWRG